MALEHCTHFCDIADEDAMSDLGARLAGHLSAGDCVLLSGPIGAGKTHLARAIIQSRLKVPEDVPSPTFTIVQTYQWPETEVWHVDLYRLSDSSELIELGLDGALESAVTMIEWPDRLPPELLPDQVLHIDIAQMDTGRRVTAKAIGSRWSDIGAVFQDE
ncbi:MAG: tRNA (adenosine(37)-N6)-threonylcarbamoyltransferase complex ATPase subunit type 1 TsaE [Paracoccaceae bacterium]|nr:tRNA (adenosine(37)-N6)-threonylcarbamoyltransferase complex ATPase subunit type 1 TsaE [Paracoccaceae bacterium]